MNLANFARIAAMELFDEFACVRHIFEGFPGFGFSRSLVSGPSNEVMKLASNSFRIEYGNDFVFGLTIDFDRWRRRLMAIGNGVASIRGEKIRMENWMKKTHRARKLKTKCGRTYSR